MGRFLYRGTTLGWAGNSVLQNIPITPTTHDPLVATLFAIECLRHGEAVVHFVKWDRAAALVDSKNWFSPMEDEVALKISPVDFMRELAEGYLSASKAREILLAVGFDLPVTIASHDRVHSHLKEFTRLSAEQIEQFDRLSLSVMNR